MNNHIANVRHDSTPVYRRGVRAYFGAAPIPPTRARHRAFIVGDYVETPFQGVQRIETTGQALIATRRAAQGMAAFVLASSALTDTDNGW